MLIGELAKKTGLTRATIRYYESFGLLEKPTRPNRFNNYKDYPEINIGRLQFVVEQRATGFKLREIAAILREMKKSNCDCAKGAEILRKKAESVNLEIRELQNIKTRLRRNMAAMQKQSAQGKSLP